MKTLIFLRHGDTEYTEKFPDLTEKGKRQAEEAVLKIKEIIKEEAPNEIYLTSSTRQRAKGVASIIAKHIPCTVCPDEDLIRDMDLYDKEEVLEYWNSFGSHIEAAKRYPTDPWFESGEHAERRTDIEGRFISYLTILLSQYEDGSLPDVSIHVSHFEVLWKLIEKFYLQEPLGHCEPIVIQISEEEKDVDICTYFRGSSFSYTVNSVYEFLERQFY